MTLTIELENLDAYQWLLKLLKKRNVNFQLIENNDLETQIIKERLHAKYVVTGEWATMDDEDRQDAVLLEQMLYEKEQPSEGYLPETDTQQFLTDVKKGLYAPNH